MPQSKGPFYMTTAIAYTSGKPHIGNTYEIVLEDRKATMYFFRQELTSMVRRLSLRLRKLELHLRNLLTMFQQRLRESGIL